MLNRCVAALVCLMLVADCAIAQSSTYYSPQTSSPSAVECEAQPDMVGCEGLLGETGRARMSAGADGTAGLGMRYPSSPLVISTDDWLGGPRDGSMLERTRVPLAPVPPEAASEFQDFVESSVGAKLPVFGKNLFTDVPSTFAQVGRVPVPADYVIGPGDQLLIRGWGQISVNARVVVDRSGEIFLPKIGSLSVAGLKFSQLGDYLRTSIGRVFKNFDLTVTLGQLRSIQIFVVGHARRPGAYTVSSLTTLMNAVFTSGGPSSSGSMRHIQLKRDNQVVTEFDLYDLLLRGDKSKDVVLMPGDVVYIPPMGPQIAITGSVSLPAIYELRSTTTLGEQIDAAGGLTSVADGGRVIVERIEAHSTRNLDEFKLDDNGLKRELRDGDLVRVFSISPKFENAVTIRGNVAEPGRYPWHDGMRVRDLIPSREFLLTREFWLRQNGAVGSRGIASDWQLESRTKPSLERAADKPNEPQAASGGTQGAENSVQDPKQGAQSQMAPSFAGLPRIPEVQADLRDVVKRNAPEINWEYAMIQRVNPADLSTELIPFNLGKAILGEDDADNKLLRPGDVVTIFSQSDLAVSMERQNKFVRLEGEFRAPGIYKVQPGETLRSLVSRAGGFSSEAYLFGTQLTRESARAEQQRSLDRMIENMEIEVERSSLSATGASSQTQDALRARTESQRAMVEKFKTIKATGRVVLNITPSQTGLEAFPEVALEDGDRVYVPHKPETVSVLGSVYNQSSFLYKNGMRVSDYMKMAGSGTRDADMKHTFVLRADGSVLSDRTSSSAWSGGLMSIRILPGDMVVVPAQLDKGGFMRGFKDWTQVISQMAFAAASVALLTH